MPINGMNASALTHPRTEAAQFVEERKRDEEMTIPKYVVAEAPAVTKVFLNKFILQLPIKITTALKTNH
jgi:hypothetical protein